MKKLILSILAIVLFTCDDITEVEDISSKTVRVLAPVHNSVLSITNINFTWDALPEAEQYQLQIATPTFETATQILQDTTITITSYKKILGHGDYQWRIRAENSGYVTEYTTQKFTIEE